MNILSFLTILYKPKCELINNDLIEVKITRKKTRHLVYVGVLCACGGFLFGYFLNGYLASVFFGGPCEKACCVDFNPSIDANFGVDPDGSGVNQSYFVGFAIFDIASIDSDFYNLVIAQDFADNDEMMEWMNANYPDSAYLTYMQIASVLIGDARGMINPSYANKSLDGKSLNICEPGVLLVGYIQFGVYYENATFYGTYTALVYDISGIDSLIDAINTIPAELTADCGETFSIQINSLTTNPGAGDPVVTVTINGIEYDLPVEVD